MPDLKQLSVTEDKDFFHTYKRLQTHIDRGEGCYLYTKSGEKILDMFGGLAVNVLGYNYPRINHAIEEQIKKYIHISNFFYQEKQIELAEKMLEMSGYSKVFFSNSGTESIEAAIKLVRKYFKGTEKKDLISFSGSFHGRTMGGLSLTVRKKYREDFEPFLPNTKHLAFNDVEELEKNIDNKTAAVFLEFIQGEGGVNSASQEFVSKLKELQSKHEFIIVADEIQSGVGRTGKLHSFEHYGIKPDIITLAKGIGGGLPLGAILGSDRVRDTFTYSNHGSTFGGSPVAASCGVVIFDELKNGLMDNVTKIGNLLLSDLEKIKLNYSGKIKDIRGKGFMLGIELNTTEESSAGQRVVSELMDENILVNCTNGNVIRLLPPFILSEEDAQLFIKGLENVLKRISFN